MLLYLFPPREAQGGWRWSGGSNASHQPQCSRCGWGGQKFERVSQGVERKVYEDVRSGINYYVFPQGRKK